MIQEKAQQFAAILDVTDFEAPCGWFHCFRQRNAITWHTVSGEEKAADEAAAAMWREETFREMAEEGDPGELWSEVTELLAVDSVSFDDYVLCDKATMTSAELTTEDIVQSIRDDEGSDNGMNDGVANNEGGTAAPELCDETVMTADMMDIVQIFRIFLDLYLAKLEAQGMPRTYAKEARCQVTKRINEKIGDLRKLEDRSFYDIVKTGTTTVAAAILAVVKIKSEESAADTICPNAQQNIMVVSTPNEDNAARGIPIDTSVDELDRNIVNERNPLAGGAKRIGSTTTVIVVFKGPKAASCAKVKNPIGDPCAKIQRQQLLQEKPQQDKVTIT
ncbi:POGO family transposase [Ixodes scapularis]|uniref:POGO family transposase n=1 Tax=Ixodes scapularis TaxID=6945 RepID=B7PK97_IXOSC|nr:POGO family transposase [Ixodes scapularis]|eukprot:XP_002409772.1 POGO family transposase [Ixodes scapularis]